MSYETEPTERHEELFHMSETEQRETEYIAGVIEGITQKGPDKWQVAVKPDGSQYSKNLWTKDGELVTTLSAKIGQHGGFVCGISHWTNNEGKPIRSLWIDSHEQADVSDLHIAAPQANASPSAAAPTFVATGSVPPPKPVDGMTPEKWDAKERRDYRSRAWAQTLAAFQHTIKVDEDPEEVFKRLQPFQRKVYVDVTGMFAFPPDETDVPF